MYGCTSLSMHFQVCLCFFLFICASRFGCGFILRFVLYPSRLILSCLCMYIHCVHMYRGGGLRSQLPLRMQSVGSCQGQRSHRLMLWQCFLYMFYICAVSLFCALHTSGADSVQTRGWPFGPEVATMPVRNPFAKSEWDSSRASGSRDNLGGDLRDAEEVDEENLEGGSSR